MPSRSMTGSAIRVFPSCLPIVVGGFSALFFSAIIGGSRKRRLVVGLGAALGGILILAGLVASGWFSNPGLGPGVVIIGAGAAAVFGTLLFTGLENRRVLGIAMATAGVGVAVAYGSYSMLRDPNWSSLLGSGAGRDCDRRGDSPALRWHRPSSGRTGIGRHLLSSWACWSSSITPFRVLLPTLRR